MIRTFVFSDDVFQGFTLSLNINNTYTVDKIIDLCVLHLKIILEQLNLEILVTRLSNKRFQLCNITLSDIFNNPNLKTYICPL